MCPLAAPGAAGREKRVGIGAEQRSAFLGLERADADFLFSDLAQLHGLSQIEEMPSVRQEEGETVAVLLLGRIELGRLCRGSSCGGDSLEGVAQRRRKEDHALAIPGSAAATLGVA